MNVEETKEAIKVMEAFVDGEEIEFDLGDGWQSYLKHNTPSWNWGEIAFRTKPKPLECWVNFNRDGSIAHCVAVDAPEYSQNAAYVHLREVTE